MAGIRGGRPSMRGSSRLTPRKPIPGVTPDANGNRNQGRSGSFASYGAAPVAPKKKRVLFVCIGNSCRSQMAEGFARTYGADVMEIYSAGLSPAPIVQPLTVQTMLERNIRLDGQFPKGLELMVRDHFDVVVNLAGQRLNMPAGRMLEWNVRDPIGCTDEVYRQVADQLENLVMGLVIETKAEQVNRTV